MQIDYAIEPDLDSASFIDVLKRSTLAERRPVDDPDTIAAMLKHANLIVTARINGKLIGIARSITDFSFCCYLSELAVDVDVQRQGIGKELVRRTHDAAGRHTTLLLLAAPNAASYYPHIGMTKHPSCWLIPKDTR